MVPSGHVIAEKRREKIEMSFCQNITIYCAAVLLPYSTAYYVVHSLPSILPLSNKAVAFKVWVKNKVNCIGSGEEPPE